MALTTRGGSAAASDGAHLVSRQRSCLRSRQRRAHRRHRLPPPSGGHGFTVFNRRAYVVVETWDGVVPGHLTVDGNANEEPSLGVSSSTHYYRGHTIPPTRGHSESPPPPSFLSNFCVIFVSHTPTAGDERIQTATF